MQLQEIMNTDFDVVSANDFAEEALVFMQRYDKRFLFVLDRESIVGVVLLEELSKTAPRLLKDATVRDFISREAIQVSPNVTLGEASRMLKGRPRACLFVTWNEQPIGVVTHADLLRALEISGNQAKKRPRAAELETQALRTAT